MSRTVEPSDDWRRRFPAAAAAQYVRDYLDAALHDLEDYRIAQALSRLSGWRWRSEVDLDGVPPRVLHATQKEINAAWGYLQEKPDPDVTSAKDALRDARALYEIG